MRYVEAVTKKCSVLQGMMHLLFEDNKYCVNHYLCVISLNICCGDFEKK